MKKLLIACLACISSFIMSTAAYAQDAAPVEIAPKALISSKDIVEVEKRMIFDGSKSLIFGNKKNVRYQWDFGDGNTRAGQEVVHTYKKPGEYTVTLTVTAGELKDSVKRKVLVYKNIIILVSDNVRESKVIDALFDYAKQKGVYLHVIDSFESSSELVTEEILLQKLIKSSEELTKAKQVVIWTRSSTGLNIFSRLVSEVEEKEITFSNKSIIFITEENISTIGRIAQGSYNFLRPLRIVLTRKEALYPLVDAPGTTAFLDSLTNRAVTYEVIDSDTKKVSLLSFMTSLINYLIEKNVPINTIMLILMLPVIATVVAFLKQVIGLSTLGVYTPSIITLSFLALDYWFAIALLLVIIFAGTAVRFILKKYRLLYVPRMALVLTVVAIIILAVIAIGAAFDLTQVVSVAIFPMLIMSTLAEKFVSIQGSKGLKAALYIIFETILVATIAYIMIGGELYLFLFTIKWEFLRTLIFGYPELIFLFIFFNVILGRWTGLRLSEYFRFKDLLRGAEE